jgi:hypothetical protein
MRNHRIVLEFPNFIFCSLIYRPSRGISRRKFFCDSTSRTELDRRADNCLQPPHIVCARIAPPSYLSLPTNMAPAFDKCKERPAQIDTILNGLDRYNPETTEIFREYVNQQCEEKFFDAYACLALLKLYVNQHPQHVCLNDEQVSNHVSYYLTPFGVQWRFTYISSI